MTFQPDITPIGPTGRKKKKKKKLGMGDTKCPIKMTENTKTLYLARFPVTDFENVGNN